MVGGGDVGDSGVVERGDGAERDFSDGTCVDVEDVVVVPGVFGGGGPDRESVAQAEEHLGERRVGAGVVDEGEGHGDTVVVNTEDNQPFDGAVFAVNYEGELVIKRLVRDAGQWWLSSDNPNQAAYPRKICDAGSVILGRIVHKQSERI